MWGRPGTERNPETTPRFIPTRVGQTSLENGAGMDLSVHPHACGADEQAEELTAQIDRFIPTRVGQTVSEEQEAPVRAVHPHACGADAVFGLPALCVFGSSPRVWGRLYLPAFRGAFLRFIPTRVGQTHTVKRR